MIPGPPPVMIAQPAEPSIRATRRACSYCGWPGGVRAEPKIETALPTLGQGGEALAQLVADALDPRLVGELGHDPGGLGLEQLLIGGRRVARLAHPDSVG
jgi:hypothetical protein